MSRGSDIGNTRPEAWSRERRPDAVFPTLLTGSSFMAKINLRHKQRMTDRVKDGYFKYEPQSHVPPGTPGRHGVYLPKNWVSTRQPPAEITIEGHGIIDAYESGSDR